MSQPINLTEVMKDAAKDPFAAIRGNAIQAYANLEQSLCNLFATFSGMPMEAAGIVFFKIVGARTRDNILIELHRKKYGDTYSAFWNPLVNFVSGLSGLRNRIVHWNVAVEVGDKGFERHVLMQPDFFNYEADTRKITDEDLVDFIEKCVFVARLCRMFFMILTPRVVAHMKPEQLQEWQEVFGSRFEYPPASTHPLVRDAAAYQGVSTVLAGIPKP